MKKIFILTFILSFAAISQTLDADNCLEAQSLDALDININKCPDLPSIPESVSTDAFSGQIGLGAWELGTTAEGETYKYGELVDSGASNILEFYGGGSTEVNSLNISCWAKGYFRLRAILQNPPVEYIKLRNAGFQGRFFQFQTDLRNGRTGFKRISSYQDHLVKWVTVITEDGECIQPTFSKFQDYARSELKRRGL